jgi:SAM-dependent methyltransferase
MIASHLRPDPEQLGAEWKALVEAEYEQTERVREWQEQDYYQSVAAHFVDNPHREGDEMLNRLRSFCAPELSWLDVGAGGGRNALPLALLSKQVIAIEPSVSMREALTQSARQYGIENVEVVDARWPDGAERVSADFSLMAHVGYDIRDINRFLDGLERATRRRCFATLMSRAPSGGFTQFWPEIHGEERFVLPALSEFVHVLLARGATPDIQLYPRDVEHIAPDDIRQNARRRLWLAEGSAKDKRLQQLVEAAIARSIDEFKEPITVGLVSWAPGLDGQPTRSHQ